jgi:hypothetical protein
MNRIALQGEIIRHFRAKEGQGKASLVRLNNRKRLNRRCRQLREKKVKMPEMPFNRKELVIFQLPEDAKGERTMQQLKFSISQ